MAGGQGGGRKKTPEGNVHGIAIVDKEPGWTSHDVVAKSRGLLGTRKVGHSGTLDPDATGVLVLGVGKATRLLRFLQLLPKGYECEIVLGVETHSLDATGTVTATHDMAGVTPDQVAAATKQFVGDITQIPPMVSAVKVQGKRLHELARQGITIEREPRPVTVYRFDTEPTDDPLVYHAVVECSSGTYVRTLAADLGTALGGGAHLRNLRRTSVGAFTLADAKELESIEVLPLVEAVRGFPIVRADEQLAAAVRVGSVLDLQTLGVAGRGPWPVIDEDDNLLAMYELHTDGRAKPTVVLVA